MTIKVRAHECMDCKTLWAAKVELSKSTPNISGEKTQFCPSCGSRCTMGGAVNEIEVSSVVDVKKGTKMSNDNAGTFLQALAGNVGSTAIERDIAAMQPVDRVAYALLVLADVLNERFGEFTFHVGDGTQPGVLEALVMALRDKL